MNFAGNGSTRAAEVEHDRHNRLIDFARTALPAITRVNRRVIQVRVLRAPDNLYRFHAAIPIELHPEDSIPDLAHPAVRRGLAR